MAGPRCRQSLMLRSPTRHTFLLVIRDEIIDQIIITLITSDHSYSWTCCDDRFCVNVERTGNSVSNFSALELVSRRQEMNEAQSNSMDDEVLWYNGGTIPLEHQLAPPAIISPFHYSNHRLLWYVDVLNSLISLSALL